MLRFLCLFGAISAPNTNELDSEQHMSWFICHCAQFNAILVGPDRRSEDNFEEIDVEAGSPRT